MALNTVITVELNEPIDPLSINENSFRLYDQTDRFYETVDISIAKNGRQIQFTIDEGLIAGHAYRVYVSHHRYLYDLAGNRFNNTVWDFTAGDQEDNTAPSVKANNLSANVNGVPLNAPIILEFDEEVTPHSVNNMTVVLSDGINEIAGTIVLSTDRLTLTFTPTDYLAADTQYTLSLNNVFDIAGNAINADVLTFKTDDTDVADTTAPRIMSLSPLSGTTDVSVTRDIVLTFSEAVDARNIDGLVRIYTSAGDIRGDYSLVDNVLTFTPENPLPGSALIYLRSYTSDYYDQAGNRGYTSYYASFTTEALAN